MPGFYVNERTIAAGEGGVLAHMGGANPGAFWVFSMFVIEGPFEDQNFLSAPMPVCIELSIGRPSY